MIDLAVALYVTGDLPGPVVGVVARAEPTSPLTPRSPVPEIAVTEDRETVGLEKDVGLAWDVGGIDFEPYSPPTEFLCQEALARSAGLYDLGEGSTGSRG